MTTAEVAPELAQAEVPQWHAAGQDPFVMPTFDEGWPTAGYQVLSPRGRMLSGLWTFADAPGQRWAQACAESFAARHAGARLELVSPEVSL